MMEPIMEPERCTMCSDDIEDEPFADGWVTWNGLGMDMFTLCSPACMDLQLDQWREYAADKKRKMGQVH